MALEVKLSKPPIYEALIDIRFQASDNFTIANASAVARDIRTPEEKTEERHEFVAHFDLVNDPHATYQPPQLSAVLLRDDSRCTVRSFRRDGLTASIVKGYKRWEDLESLAEPVFQAYARHANPIAVTRVATRFVNVIEVPHDTIDLDDYVLHGPQIPGQMLEHVIEFSHRTVLGRKTDKLIGILTIGTNTTAFGQKGDILVDVDAFSVEAIGIDFEQVRHVLRRLREMKNSMFFGAVTDHALERYK